VTGRVLGAVVRVEGGPALVGRHDCTMPDSQPGDVFECYCGQRWRADKRVWHAERDYLTTVDGKALPGSRAR
jgi:hypothetical protein